MPELTHNHPRLTELVQINHATLETIREAQRRARAQRQEGGKRQPYR